MTRKKYLRVLIVGLLFCLCACAEPADDQPTPEASKRFLKLRGYNFDNQSFLSAANAGDELAVKGFASSGNNLNAKDENGDTALTAADARGDLKSGKMRSQGGGGG